MPSDSSSGPGSGCGSPRRRSRPSRRGSARPRPRPRRSRTSRAVAVRRRRASRPGGPRRRRSSDAARSIAEWIASVMIATEPVIRPATTLSRSAPCSRRSRPARGSSRRSAAARGRRAEPLARARPGGAAAVGDRVLLGVGELGHRAAVGHVVGHEHRVVAEAAARRAALGDSAPSQRALEQVLGAVGRRRGRSRRRSAARDAGGRLARAAWRGSRASVACSPGVARGAHAGRAAERLGLDAGVVGDRRRGRSPRAAARALISAFSANVSPVLGRQLDAVGQRLELDARAAAARTRAACGRCGWRARAARRAHADGGGLRSRAASSIPLCASASSSSRCARESGVRSAVAWTSTSPPSPVMTTFASTSAVESSG